MTTEETKNLAPIQGLKGRVEEALQALRQGTMVILVDDEDRENEGDLAMAAEKVTPEAINFIRTQTGGVICLSMTNARADELGLPPMVAQNTSSRGTPFTVSIDARDGVSTGISSADRARTILTAAAESCRAEDLVRPGHIFPLRARDGGVLVRSGHTEGVVDLCRLARMRPIGVISEIMNPDGTMARMPDLEKFSKVHRLPIITIAELIRYRMQHEMLIRKVSEVDFPSDFGQFRLISFENDVDRSTHVALVKGASPSGEIASEEPVLVRVHSECLTGDTFASRRCDCGRQMIRSLEMIEEAGRGVFLYIRQEGRGIGLLNKIKAYALQEQGMDTVEANRHLGFKADLRDYGIGAQILVSIGLRKMRLMTNNPRKIVGLDGFGLEVVERVPIEMEPVPENIKYLKTKREKLGHLLKKV